MITIRNSEVSAPPDVDMPLYADAKGIIKCQCTGIINFLPDYAAEYDKSLYDKTYSTKLWT